MGQEMGDQTKAVAKGLNELLNYQIGLAGGKKDKFLKKRLTDPLCLAYLYGFINAAADIMEIIDEQERMYIFQKVYDNVFGKQGHRYLIETISNHEYARFQKARDFGYQQFECALKEETEPTGLAEFLRGDLSLEK